MRRSRLIPLLLVGLGAAGFGAGAQPTIYVSPDVPTEPDTANPPPFFLPWQVVEHVHLGGSPYGLALSVPGDPAIDALQKLDQKGGWIFSIEAPNRLLGSFVPGAEPRDVIRINSTGPTLTMFFDGSCVSGVVPLGSSIDALYLDGGDGGDLIVSFDIPTTVGSATFQPSELVRYTRVANNSCGWALVGSEIDFALTLSLYFPSSGNVTGADRVGDDWILSLDIPTDLGPPFLSTFTPGQIVLSDGSVAQLFDNLQAEGLGGWPISSQVDALSCQSNPGRIDPQTTQILLDKVLSGVTPDIEIICPGSCSSGAEVYGLYEGKIASVNPGGVYDHTMKFCDVGCPTNFQFTPGTGDTYYLVVPHNHKEEGSYGTDSDGTERPQAAVVAGRCVELQTLTACP